MRLLFVASDKMEYRGLLGRASAVQHRNIALDWACTGRLAGHDAMFVANGVGAVRAAQAVDAALAVFPADAAISTGYCGALLSDYGIADVIVGTCVLSNLRSFRTAPISGSRPFSSGTIYSSDKVERTALGKVALRTKGASAVEMEAAGVAERAEARGLPFYCVRAVTDLAQEDMANDFQKALRPDGHFDTMIILGNALRRPSVRLPELIRMRNRCVRASHALGDFFADCRI